MDFLLSIFGVSSWRGGPIVLRPRTVIVGTLAFTLCCLTWRTLKHRESNGRMSHEELVAAILSGNHHSTSAKDRHAQVRVLHGILKQWKSSSSLSGEGGQPAQPAPGFDAARHAAIALSQIARASQEGQEAVVAAGVADTVADAIARFREPGGTEVAGIIGTPSAH